MTNEEEQVARHFLEEHRTYVRNASIVPHDIAKYIFDLADRLLAENSQLRVRDSNVTAHSLNVMSVNEDLQTRLKVVNNRNCGTCKHWADGGTNYGTERHPIRQCCIMGSAINLGSDTDCWYGTPPEFSCADWEAK